MHTARVTSIFVFIAGVLSALPSEIYAAEVFFTVVPNPVPGDTATIVEARIEPEDAQLNVVEGGIYIVDTEASMTSVLVETGGSVLTLWPVKPIYTDATHSIIFTGGTRKNFSSEGLLFRLRLFTSESKKISLMWVYGTAYLGDGKGTKVPLTSHSIEIALEKSEPNAINPFSADSIPPDVGKIEIGREENMHDGKNFLHISATDNKSGIDRIEITENGVVTEAENDTYVLRDQENDPEVLITAFDNSGNSTSVKFPEKNTVKIFIILLIIIILFILGVRYSKRSTRKRVNKK